MAYIKVNTQKILEYQQIIETSKKRLESIREQYVRISVDKKISDNTYEYIEKSMDNEIQVMNKMQIFLGETASQYDYIFEKNILLVTAGDKTESVTPNVNEKGKNKISDIVSGILSGTRLISKGMTRSVKKALYSIETVIDGKYTIIKKYPGSKFNEYYKKFNNGVGLSGRYVTETIDNYPIAKTTKYLKRISNAIDIFSAGVELFEGIKNTNELVNNLKNDETISSEDKDEVLKTAQIIGGITTAVDVAAPFVGTAVGAVVSAVATPAVGVVVGALVEGTIDFTTDVIANENVVKQLHSSATNIADSVQTGVQTVADSAEKIANSSSAGEAINNTLDLVADVGKSAVDVAATIVKESIDTQVELVKSAVDVVTNSKPVKWITAGVKKLFNW